MRKNREKPYQNRTETVPDHPMEWFEHNGYMVMLPVDATGKPIVDLGDGQVVELEFEEIHPVRSRPLTKIVGYTVLVITIGYGISWLPVLIRHLAYHARSVLSDLLDIGIALCGLCLLIIVVPFVTWKVMVRLWSRPDPEDVDWSPPVSFDTGTTEKGQEGGQEGGVTIIHNYHINKNHD